MPFGHYSGDRGCALHRAAAYTGRALPERSKATIIPLVELRRIELLTSSLRTTRSPS